ncbi:MAG: neutral/alkaline non-lysosomal ceramidase N-terminal domain-containing protein [Bryobacteraceae bacterium]
MKLISLLALFAASGFAQNWQAGVAKTLITPREPIWMAGYAARTKPSEGVRQEIFSKALALRDGNGHTVVIVTFDLVGISREQAAEIAAQCLGKFKLERQQILFNASHSHSGPLGNGARVVPSASGSGSGD